MMENVILFGASGQLGRVLTATSPDNVHLRCFSRENLDLTDGAAVQKIISGHSPSVIINAAAYTAVDRAETEADMAYSVNEQAIKFIAEFSATGTRIIHLSTDFVFSGPGKAPHRPEDMTAPVSVYGKSKLAGEMVLQVAHPGNSVILRTSWLYSAEGRNFVTLMLALLDEKDELNVVNDQYGSPTCASTLSDVIWRMAQLGHVKGIHHWSDRGVITWYDFACEIQKQGLALELLKKEISINPVPAKDYPTVATRPAYSALDSSSTEALLGIRTRPWKDQLFAVLKRIKRASN